MGYTNNSLYLTWTGVDAAVWDLMQKDLQIALRNSRNRSMHGVSRLQSTSATTINTQPVTASQGSTPTSFSFAVTSGQTVTLKGFTWTEST